jgi:cytochrome P450
MLLTGAANHDPRHFPDPGRLDFARANARDHLAFGKQWHFCMGAPLARFEFAVALELLTKTFPDMRLLAGEPAFVPIITVRALERLMVETAPPRTQ